eukprot:CAMPEP_0183506996 /NCGR_PEP_ID=MMETSP0371-20130417/7889_1 /TAXON_ID=268820 /ORGANISM="Peridinium aciculiferum, Strain PAER-2" /LENGTH=57 /DNA_ID=CAMNT_0025703101 /DNA_START=414 /DNA_END=584 /DNA_ORIENTATION=+
MGVLRASSAEKSGRSSSTEMPASSDVDAARSSYMILYHSSGRDLYIASTFRTCETPP